MSDTVLTSLQDGVFTLTLNNPSKHNCMGFEMLYALRDAFDEASGNDDVKVVVITGAGEKSFSTGANIKEFNALVDKDVNRWIEDGNKIFNQLEKLGKPTVALINGYAMGGGLELALCCDFRLATTNALLASPELKNGWLPGWGGMARLPRLIGEANAKRVVLLAQHITAEESLSLGLLTKILPEETLDAELQEFIAILKDMKPEIYSMAKDSLMDRTRTTEGTDLHFDIMAVHAARKQ
ncbi:MAG: enoyl-CoA hydratase/isomerase family protein [Cyclobacteriaceae bacterium]